MANTCLSNPLQTAPEQGLFPVLGCSSQAVEIEYPGVEFELFMDHHRHVSGSLRLDKANPMGRTTCKVQYTVAAYWSDQDHLAALSVAAHWFRDIGGIGLLSNRQLCHIVPRLKAGQQERCMHWAIDAYATAEWHRTKRLWKPIGAFFATDAYDTWLERSDGYRAHLDELERERQDRERARRRAAGLMPIRELADVALAQHLATARADAARYRELRDRAARETYERWLTTREQAALRRQCELERCGTWHEEDDGPMTFEHPVFRDYVYSRALYIRARREGVSPESIMGFTPRTPYYGQYRELQYESDTRARREQPHQPHQPPQPPQPPQVQQPQQPANILRPWQKEQAHARP